MKAKIGQKILLLQQQIEFLDLSGLNEDIEYADNRLNNLLLQRSSMLKERETLEKEIVFLEKMLDKYYELDGE